MREFVRAVALKVMAVLVMTYLNRVPIDVLSLYDLVWLAIWPSKIGVLAVQLLCFNVA